MRKAQEISYLVNDHDRVVSVSPGWVEFARSNDGEELTPESVTGRELWDFIHDEVTRELYREVLACVRSGRPASLVLRCDGPAERRLIELRVDRRPGDHVEFRTVRLAAKRRPPQRLLDRRVPRSAARVQVCGWCDRVNTGVGGWKEVEAAAEEMGLNRSATVPGIEPCTCPVCREKVLHALGKSSAADAGSVRDTDTRGGGSKPEHSVG